MPDTRLSPDVDRKQFRKGVYETSYGNAAYVSGPKAKSAFDLDMQERIPLSEVNPRKFLRKAEPGDAPSRNGWD